MTVTLRRTNFYERGNVIVRGLLRWRKSMEFAPSISLLYISSPEQADMGIGKLKKTYLIIHESDKRT